MGALAAVGLVLPGLVGLAPSAGAADAHVIDGGHVDGLDVTLVDGELALLIHDDNTTPASVRDPADVRFHVDPDAEYVVPDNLPPAYSFIGDPGDTVWLLPQVQSENPDVVWLGWASQRLPAGTVTGSLDLSLVDVEGPGDVVVFQSDAFGNPLPVWNSADGLPDSLELPQAAHVHASWVFTAPGDYTLTFQADGTSASTGEAMSTGPVDYAFTVGELSGGEEPVETQLTVTGLADHYHTGDTISLSAVQDPQTEYDHWHWFVRAEGAEEYEVIEDAFTADLTLEASAELDGAMVIARLYDEDHAVVGESEPVVIVVDDHGEEPVETELTITGLADHYHTGDEVELSAHQDPEMGLDHYHWFVRAAGSDEYVVVPEGGATYSFTATAEMDGASIVVKLYGDGHEVVAESEPVVIVVDDHGEEPAAATQSIVATLSDDAGALVVSVDPDDREVVMGPFELGEEGDRWGSRGELRPVRVTDTRSGQTGWNVAGQAGAFTSDGASVGPEHLGWTPEVVGQSDAQGVEPGPTVAPGDEPGQGLSAPRTLASADEGRGRGTATLGADLDLQVPTSTPPGTYTATLTITAI